MRNLITAICFGLTTLVFADCASDPQCIYENPGFLASDAKNLYDMTSCDSFAHTITFSFAKNPEGYNEITRYYVYSYSYCCSNFYPSVQTSLHSSASTTQNFYFGGSLTSITASYINNATNTSLRQLNFTVSGSIISIPPTTNASLEGTTNVTKAITGQFIGFKTDSKINTLHVMQRYQPTFSMPSSEIVQIIGQPSQTQNVSFTSKCPNSYAEVFNVSKPAYLSWSYSVPAVTPSKVTLTVPFFDDTPANQLLANKYSIELYYYCNNICAYRYGYSSYKNVTLQTQLCLTSTFAAPSGFPLSYEQYLYYPASNYSFPAIVDSQNPICGSMKYTVINYNRSYQDGVNFYNQLSPTFRTLSGRSYPTDVYNYTFQIQASFNSTAYSQTQNSTVLSIRWLDPCDLPNNTINATPTIADITTQLLVSTYSSYYYNDYFLNYWSQAYCSYCCGYFKRELFVTPAFPQTLSSNLYLYNYYGYGFYLYLNPQTDQQVGIYTAFIKISLSNYPQVAPVYSNNFTINVTYCQVNTLSLSIQFATTDYTLTQPQQTNQLTVTQSPNCGYPVTFNITTTAPNNALFNFDDTTRILKVGVYTDLSIFQTGSLFTFTANVTINDSRQITARTSSNRTNTLRIFNPCFQTTFVTTLPISISMFSLNSSLVLTFAEFDDSISISQSNQYYCGARAYQLITSSDPYILTLDAATRTLSYQSLKLSDAGNYTRTLKVSLLNYTNITYTQQINIEVYNPCWRTSLQNQIFNNMFAVVMQPYIQYTFDQVKDSVSIRNSSNGSGTDICGPREYSVTFTKLQGGDITSVNCFVPTPNTQSVIEAGSNSNTQSGNYSLVVNVVLSNYPNITLNSSSFNLEIKPCKVDTFTINSADYTQYVLNYNYQLPNVSQIFTLETTQNFACGYNPKITVLIPNTTTQNATAFVSVVSSQTAVFTVKPTQRSQVGNYTITLTYELTDYPTYIYTEWKKITSFVIQILDPCIHCQVVPQQIRNMFSFSGYPDVIADKLEYSYFSSDPAYQKLNLPTRGVYFYDIPSRELGRYDFCGNKSFNFRGSLTPNVQITGKNGENLTFSTTENSTTPEIFYVSLVVNMTQNASCSFVSEFNAQITVITPIILYDQLYILGEARATISVGPFIYKSVINSQLPSGVYYQAYLQSKQTLLKPPIYCPSLQNKTGGLVDLQPFIQFNASTFELSYFTRNTLDVGTYYVVICENFEKQLISYVSQFSLQVTQPVTLNTAQTNKLPTVQANQQIIQSCEDSNITWSYQIPNVQDPQGYDVTTKVNLGQLMDYITYDSQDRKLVQVKSTFGLVGLQKIQVFFLTSAESKSLKNSYTLELVFLCTPPYDAENKFRGNVRDKIAKQNQFPQATISKISNTGEVTIKFSAPMSASKEERGQIMNGTVLVEGKNQQIFRITLSNPNGLTKVVNQIAYQVTSYNSIQLQLQLILIDPSAISTYQVQDQLQISILANWLFHDNINNYMKQETLTNVKNIPPQIELSSSQKLTAQVEAGAKTVNQFMGGQAIVQIIMGGSVQQMLGALRTLQIQVHILLVNIGTPPNAQIYFSQLLNLVTMDLFPQVTSWVQTWLIFDETQGVDEIFDQYGYASLYVFENYGSTTLIFFVVPLLLILFKIVEAMKIAGLSERALRWRSSICWNGVIGYFFEMYLVMTICGLMNLYYIRVDSTANILSLFLTVFFLLVSAFLPIFYGSFYFKHLEEFRGGNKKLIEKYGDLIQELNLFRKGKQALAYPLVVMIRKLLLAVLILVFIKKPLFTCFAIIFTSLATGTTLGWIQPYKRNLTNSLELLNEFFVLLTSYHMLCFTDFNNPQGKLFMGTSLFFVILVNFAISIAVEVIKTCISVYKILRRKWLIRKQQVAKQNRIRERLEKAAKIHTQFLQEQEVKRREKLWRERELEHQRQQIAEKEFANQQLKQIEELEREKSRLLARQQLELQKQTHLLNEVKVYNQSPIEQHMREKMRLKREQAFAEQRQQLEQEKILLEMHNSLDIPANKKPLKPTVTNKRNFEFIQDLFQITTQNDSTQLNQLSQTQNCYENKPDYSQYTLTELFDMFGSKNAHQNLSNNLHTSYKESYQPGIEFLGVKPAFNQGPLSLNNHSLLNSSQKTTPALRNFDQRKYQQQVFRGQSNFAQNSNSRAQLNQNHRQQEYRSQIEETKEEQEVDEEMILKIPEHLLLRPEQEKQTRLENFTFR